MMSKVVILNDKLNDSEINISRNDDLIIISGAEGMIPVSLAKRMQENKANVRYEIVDNTSLAAYAFLLGKLSDKEKITEVYTDNKELKSLFLGSAPKPKAKKAPKAAAPDQEKEIKKETLLKEASEALKPARKAPKKKVFFEDIMNEPIPVPEEAPKVEVPKKNRAKKSTASKATYTMKDYKSIDMKAVKKVLKDNGYDEKYALPILEALQISTDVTLGMNVRMKLSPIESDKELIRKLGDLIEEKFK